MWHSPMSTAAPAAVTISRNAGIAQNCIPEVVGSLGVAVALAVLLMLAMAWLVWICASMPEPPAIPTEGSPLQPTSSRPALPRHACRLDALDGLRTVFVMYILIYHLRWALPAYLAPWFQQGHWAVQFFFVLSGFVACLSHETSRSGPRAFSVATARTYAVRRLSRLCPAYFVALLAVAAVSAYRGGGEPFLAWPLHALLLQSLIPVQVCGAVDANHWSQNFLPFSANGEGWFVSAIVIASLCFPLLYNLCPRGGFGITLRTFLFVVIFRSVPTFLTMANWCPIDMYTFAPVRVLEFAAGMLSAQLYREMPSWVSECGAWDWIFDGSLVSAMIPVWILSYWRSWASCENHHGDFFLTPIFCLTCMSACGLAEHCSVSERVHALQWFGSVGPNEEKQRGCECQCGFRSSGGALLSNLLASRVLVALAAYSYQAYIFQEAFIAAMVLVVPPPLLFKLWWLPVILPWFAAVISVHCLEEPLKRCIEARILATKQIHEGKVRV